MTMPEEPLIELTDGPNPRQVEMHFRLPFATTVPGQTRMMLVSAGIWRRAHAEYVRDQIATLTAERDRLWNDREQAQAAIDGCDITHVDFRDNANPDELRTKLLGVALELVALRDERDRLRAGLEKIVDMYSYRQPGAEHCCSEIARNTLAGKE